MDSRLDRRRFLRAGAGALAGAAFMPAPVLAAERVDWDDEAEIVVIGTGFAGLAAAIEARVAGRTVVVLDKMKIPGGNSVINGGYMAAAGSDLQERAGIEDSPQQMYDDMLEAGQRLNHRELARLVCERSVETLRWARDELGVSFQPEPRLLGGHSVPRSHRTTENSGSGIIRPMLEHLESAGVTPRQQMPVSALIRDDDGTIVGVRVQPGGAAQGVSSAPQDVRAVRAVVLAGGGFAADVAYRSIQDPRLTADLADTNRPGSDAGALLMAMAAGAVPLQQSWIQLGPWTSPDEQGIGLGYMFNVESAFPYGVLVEPQGAERIVDELANRKTRADAILGIGKPCISVCDSRAAKKTPDLELLLEEEVVRRFDSLTALAQAYGLPPSALRETIDEYNGMVRQGEDSAFGKPILADARPVSEPPFYAMRTWPKVHHTMGGVHIDRQARVIGRGMTAIPGLYAAGEITGGVHGAVRLGSCAITDCLVFGRIAGRQAASYRGRGGKQTGKAVRT